jgi:hypothetical protein
MLRFHRVGCVLTTVLVLALTAACRGTPPVVGDITVSPSTTIVGGEKASLTTAVTGSSGLTFRWSAARGTLSGDDAPAVLYVAPMEPGPDTVTLEVSNSAGSEVRAITIDVVAATEVVAPTSPPPVARPTAVPATTVTATIAAAPVSDAAPRSPVTDKSGECKGDTSEVLNQAAWAASDAKNWDKAITCAELVVGRWSSQASTQQSAKNDGAECLYSPDPDDNAAVDSFWKSYWAVNDVATAWFIIGISRQGKGENDGAATAYRTVIDKYGCGYAYDLRGWFWRVADAAQERLDAMP